MLVPAYLGDSGPKVALTLSDSGFEKGNCTSEPGSQDLRSGAELGALGRIFGQEHSYENAARWGNAKLQHGTLY